MKRSPARALPTLLTLVTIVLAGFSAASVQRLWRIDHRQATLSPITELREAIENDVGPAVIGERLELFAARLAADAADREAAGARVTTLGVAFFSVLGLLVLSLIAAERNARQLLHMARAARVDADRTRAQLVEAVENINEGFVLYDSDDRLVLCNRKFREAYRIVADILKPGVTSEEILRAATLRGQFPQAGEQTEEWVQKRMAQRRRFDPPFEQQLAGGRWHMVSDRSTRDGGLVGIRTDITELKRREIELREARQSLESQAERNRALAEETQQARAVLQDAIESINEGFCLYDADDRLVMCNTRFLDLHHRIRDRVAPGATFAEITRAAIESGHLVIGDAVDGAIAERVGIRRNLEDSSVEEQFDEDRWVRVSTRRMRNGGYVSVFADITMMKQREFALTSAQSRLERQTREMSGLAEAAQRANRAKSEFLAMMSHEIRTPLNGVISALNLVRDQATPPEDRRLIATARTGARSLLSILNDILDMSKIEAGMLSLDVTAFRVGDLVDEIAALCRVQAEAKGLQLRVCVDPDLPTFVTGDGDRIRQMALNYATNAIKFTEVGAVELNVEKSAAGRDMVRFEVIDTGIGIPPEKHGQVFRDFVQLDQSIRRRHGGTGLGLAITRRLARLMGGGVGFASEPGAGSNFWFEIPLPAAAAPSVDDARAVLADDAGETASLAAHGLRVLLVEDNETNLYLARLILERMGCVVTEAHDGAEAVAAIEKRAFDVVLMDISMPVMDGLEATRRIRAAGVSTPIVALSANTGPEFEEECRAAGMIGCLTKPIDVPELRARIAGIAGAALPVALTDERGKAPAPLTSSTLDQVYEDLGPDAFERVVTTCRRDIANEMAAVVGAWNAFPADSAPGAMRAAAHKLVSLAATVGADELARLSRLIEKEQHQDVDRETFEKIARDALESLAQTVALRAREAGGKAA